MSVNDKPTTDRFGHRVPSYDEMDTNDDREEGEHDG